MQPIRVLIAETKLMRLLIHRLKSSRDTQLGLSRKSKVSTVDIEFYGFPIQEFSAQSIK